jgi:glucose-6-phosphate dehydrogenase assembly protein OpcA
MENAMSADPGRRLLPSAVDVPFGEIDAALAHLGQPSRGQAGPRALTATVVVIGPLARLFEPADALERLSDRAGIRAILISNGDDPAPSLRIAGHAVVIQGLQPGFIDNAVAALRLSSLPTLIWWRGGPPEALHSVAALADRLVLDADDPLPGWRLVPAFAERTSVTDLRWTRLTRWRALMAQFFDVPEVRAATGSFRRLELAGGDPDILRLFAGWLRSSLEWASGVAVERQDTQGSAPIERVRLSNGEQELLLALAPSGTCVETAAHVRGHAGATRIVPLGEQSLASLMAEELRIRSRDRAFERALASAGEVA